MAHLERMLVPKAVLFAYLTPWGQDVGYRSRKFREMFFYGCVSATNLS